MNSKMDTNADTCDDYDYDDDNSDSDSDSVTDSNTKTNREPVFYYRADEPDEQDDECLTDDDLMEVMEKDYISTLGQPAFSSVDAYRAFITVFTNEQKLLNEEHTTKILFHFACSDRRDIAMFMLENNLCSENIFQSWIGGFLLERVFNYEDYELFEYWIRHVPNLQKIMSVQSRVTRRTFLFNSAITEELLRYEHFTPELLSIPDYKGNNFFHHLLLECEDEDIHMLLKESKITRDILLQPNNKGSNAFLHSIMYSKQVFKSIIDSGKLTNEDFDMEGPNGNPLYFSIFDSFEKGLRSTITIFLDSHYCTETRVKRYLEYNESRPLKDFIFTHRKFKMLQQQFSDKTTREKLNTQLVDLDNQILKAEIEKLKLENQMLKNTR